MEKEKTAVFIGHREIFEDTELLTKRIKKGNFFKVKYFIYM